MVPRTLAQLENEAKKHRLNIVPENPRRTTKKDYVKALQAFYLGEKIKREGFNASKALGNQLKIDSPMLCSLYSNLKEEEQDSILNGHYFAEEKADGARCIMHLYPSINKWDAFSRHLSVKDYLPVSWGSKIQMPNFDIKKVSHDIILDTEIISTAPGIATELVSKTGVVTETQLQAVTALLAINEQDSIFLQKKYNYPLKLLAFDVIYYDGEWLFEVPQHKRRKILKNVLPELQSAGLNVQGLRYAVPSQQSLFEFFETLVSEGGEGIILKDVYAPYIAEQRRTKYWVKLKRSMSYMVQQHGLADSIDGWIDGFELSNTGSWKGLVGSLDIAVMLEDADGTQRKHIIAKVTNLEYEMRKAITVEDENGKPTLDPSFYGRVVEVDGQNVSARALRLTHARIIRFREDKSADDCILSRAFVVSQVM